MKIIFSLISFSFISLRLSVQLIFLFSDVVAFAICYFIIFFLFSHFFSPLDQLDEKTWFAYFDFKQLPLHGRSAILCGSSPGFWRVELEDRICSTERHWNLWMPGWFCFNLAWYSLKKAGLEFHKCHKFALNAKTAKTNLKLTNISNITKKFTALIR
jgi:hypothetical protein